jgi:folate-binding protein YgfZ
MVVIRHGGTITETRQPFDSDVTYGAKIVSQNLSDHIFSFDGADVRDVLHGQTTRNFKALDLHRPIDGAFCDLKGRVITDFTAVLTSETTVLMRVSKGVAALLQEHLAKYLMFSKTKMTTLDWHCWGCSDSSENATLGIRVPRPDGHSEVWSSPSNPPAHAMPATKWLLFRIKRGLARIHEHSVCKYLPQDLNYDLNGFVDFDKGCYTGQEIIARLHYRGQPKRRLSLLTVRSSTQPASDERIIDSATGKSIGSVVEVVENEDAFLCLCEVVTDVATLDIELGGNSAKTAPFTGQTAE